MKQQKPINIAYDIQSKAVNFLNLEVLVPKPSIMAETSQIQSKASVKLSSKLMIPMICRLFLDLEKICLGDKRDNN